MKQANNTKSCVVPGKKKRDIDDTSVIISNEPVQVDPQLMFQRLHAIATSETSENPTLLFKYELCLV